MTLKEPTYQYIDHRYKERIGILMSVLQVDIKRRWFIFSFLPDKRRIKRRYFWRPNRQLVDRERTKYIEYGNSSADLSNLWFEVIQNEGTPSVMIDYPYLLYMHDMYPVTFRGRLHNELMNLYELNIPPF